MGLFIVLEGINGSGKSTQLALVATALRLMGYTVATTSEPTSGKYGAQLRAMFDGKEDFINIHKVARLFAEDRKEHQSFLINSLATNDVVLCDRYVGSSYAYQGEDNVVFDFECCSDCVWNSSYEYIHGLNAGFLRPDANILIKVPVDVAVDRVARRSNVPKETINTMQMVDAARLYDRWAKVDNTVIPVESENNVEKNTESIVKIIMSFMSRSKQ